MVELIQNTNFSIQFVLDKINTNESKKAEEGHPMSINQLEGFEAKDITGGSAFMSTILRLALHWKEPEEDLPNSIIMKVPSPQHHKLRGKEGELDMEDPLNKDMVDFLMAAHTKEIRFYQLFPRLESGLRLPKFFYGYGYDPKHSDGLILMEDLTPRGTTIPVLPGFSDAQVLDLLTEVARVHAVSWRFPGWEKEIGSDPISLDFLENMRVNALKLLEFNPVVFRPLLERLLPLFKVEYCARSNYSGSKYGFPACIVHGDLWTPNVIWEKNSQDEPTDRLCAIIDWQTIHAGNPCEDLHRILSLNTSGQYRRQNEERLLHFYADKVAQFMDGEAPFTLEQLRDAYKNSMQFSAMYFCFGVAYYHEMPSIIGIEPGQKERKQEELLERCRMFLEDTCKTLDEL